MRLFIFVLSLLILFQPASWATGMPMFAHQQMDYESAHSMMLVAVTAEGHCQTNDARITQAGVPIASTVQQGDHMLASCLAASSSAASFTTVVALSFESQHLNVLYYTPDISFQSHTESPEIRPPLNIRFQG